MLDRQHIVWKYISPPVIQNAPVGICGIIHIQLAGGGDLDQLSAETIVGFLLLLSHDLRFRYPNDAGTMRQAKALGLGWDDLELVGVQRCPPHDAPHCAGLIFSLLPVYIVTDVRRSGCAIVYSGGRHIWLRRLHPLGADASHQDSRRLALLQWAP